MPEILTKNLLQLINKGLDNQEIADILDISANSIPRLLKKHGINRNHIFNHNRGIKPLINISTCKDSEFFSIYKGSSIDDILFK